MNVANGYYHYRQVYRSRPVLGSSGVGTQTRRGLGPYTLETAVSDRYAEYYGGGARERCAMVLWVQCTCIFMLTRINHRNVTPVLVRPPRARHKRAPPPRRAAPV